MDNVVELEFNRQREQKIVAGAVIRFKDEYKPKLENTELGNLFFIRGIDEDGITVAQFEGNKTVHVYFENETVREFNKKLGYVI